MDNITTLVSIANLTAEHLMMNVTNTTVHHEVKNYGRVFSMMCKVVYAIGIVGNAAAIVALRVGESRVRNRKHLLLLTSLAVNDLVALMGMMCLMLVAEHVPGVRNTQVYCGLRVVLRVFGIGSVCIAVTMALERYLALTRPFLYQKQVTYFVIRTTLLVSWFLAALLTCAPMFGIGAYYNGGRGGQIQCTRYRQAVNTYDFAYGIFYVVMGTALCVVLVYCNVAVISALYAITAPRAGGPPVVRRVSKTSCRQKQRSLSSGTNLQAMTHNAATAEEVAFSRIMAVLSVFFVICWLPQMIVSALFLGRGPKHWNGLATAGNVADILMLLNYVLDPILYVHRRHWRRLAPATIARCIANCFKRSHKTSSESASMKTSCCPQDTVVVSSSGAEMKPLRGPSTPSAGGPAGGPHLTTSLLDMDY